MPQRSIRARSCGVNRPDSPTTRKPKRGLADALVSMEPAPSTLTMMPVSSTHAVAPGELRRAFSSLEILRDDVEAIDDGRELSFFAARKPA